MDYDEISDYLNTFKGLELREDILSNLNDLKKSAVNQEAKEEAKNIWCLEQVYKVKNHYLKSFKYLIDKSFYKAWCELERTDIELYFLHNHLDFTGNKYHLEYIRTNVKKLQKLFPYEYFGSRETTVKSWTCSICNERLTIRNYCEHKVGEIYNGELCLRIAGDLEFHGIALVKDPFDKYAVLFPEEKEYNYAVLEHFLENWTDPYIKWELNIYRVLNDDYKRLGRNEHCLCGSGRKYKHCCLKTGDDRHDYYDINFLDVDLSKFKPLKRITLHSWKK